MGNLFLSDYAQDVVKRLVAQGRYASEAEAVEEALRLLQREERLRDLKIEELRGEIRKGVESGSATALDVDALKAEGRRRLQGTATG